jgi:hypothetical protein
MPGKDAWGTAIRFQGSDQLFAEYSRGLESAEETDFEFPADGIRPRRLRLLNALSRLKIKPR